MSTTNGDYITNDDDQRWQCCEFHVVTPVTGLSSVELPPMVDCAENTHYNPLALFQMGPHPHSHLHPHSYMDPGGLQVESYFW